MANKLGSINVFATSDDWETVVSEVHAGVAVEFVEAGLHQTKVHKITSEEFVNSTSSASAGSTGADRIVLCIPEGRLVCFEQLQTRSGELLYKVDQKGNPDSIVVRPGGIWKDRMIIAGQLGSISNSEFSKECLIAFRNSISNEFKKIKSYWVGSEALANMENGWRLTGNERSPTEYDLKL